MNGTLFSSGLWEIALEKYASAVRLTVKLFDADGCGIVGPVHPTRLFQFFEDNRYDPGIFAECAQRCLAQTDLRPAVLVSQFHGLAVVGTSLALEGRIVGAAVAGYAFVDFSQVSEIQRLAREAGINFQVLWGIARKQAPVPKGRLTVQGELLQVLGDALLRENFRARQYEETAAIVASSDDGIIGVDLNGVITNWNRGAERLYGYTAQEAVGQRISLLIPADHTDEEAGVLDRLRRGEAIDHYETVRRRKDGTLLDISLTVSAIVDARGQIVGASKIARDITERKHAEERQQLLNRELQHRTNNLLAVIQSVATQSMSGARSLDQAREAFTARLHALANANGLLTKGNWIGASLNDLIAGELASLAPRATIEGPPLLLSSTAAQGFALVIHELATNAAKHGALSTPAGKVAIHWSVDEKGEEPTFSFSWQESGGPSVARPEHAGFGTTLLKTAIGGTEAAPNIEYAPKGVHYTLEAPLSAIAAGERRTD